MSRRAGREFSRAVSNCLQPLTSFAFLTVTLQHRSTALSFAPGISATTHCEGTGEDRSKFQFLNPKQAQSTNDQMTKTFRISIFGFRYCFGLIPLGCFAGASNLEFIFLTGVGERNGYSTALSSFRIHGIFSRISVAISAISPFSSATRSPA